MGVESGVIIGDSEVNGVAFFRERRDRVAEGQGVDFIFAWDSGSQHRGDSDEHAKANGEGGRRRVRCWFV